MKRYTNDSNVIYQQSTYTMDEALDIHMNQKGSSTPKYWIGSEKTLWGEASREQVREAMDVEKLFGDPVKKMQFLDLHYQEGVSVEDLDALLKGKGRLDGKGDLFLIAAQENNINSLYLVAHALLESKNGKSKLAEYNNFFGMGAVDDNAVAKGIQFAKAHGWDTPKKGIMGATKIIADKWINQFSGSSQSTLHGMRWNPMKPGINQYATDINWANNQTYNVYKQIKKIQEVNPLYQPLFIVPQYSRQMR